MVGSDIAGTARPIQTQVARPAALSSPLSCVLGSAGHRPPRGEGWSLGWRCVQWGPHAWEKPRNTACWAGHLDAFHRPSWAQPMRLATRSAGPAVPGDEDGAGRRRSQAVSIPLDRQTDGQTQAGLQTDSSPGGRVRMEALCLAPSMGYPSLSFSLKPRVGTSQ